MAGRVTREQRQSRSLPGRLLWFAALWLAGVAAVALASLLIRAALL
jgi:hypothetical protein